MVGPHSIPYFVVFKGIYFACLLDQSFDKQHYNLLFHRFKIPDDWIPPFLPVFFFFLNRKQCTSAKYLQMTQLQYLYFLPSSFIISLHRHQAKKLFLLIYKFQIILKILKYFYPQNWFILRNNDKLTEVLFSPTVCYKLQK